MPTHYCIICPKCGFGCSLCRRCKCSQERFEPFSSPDARFNLLVSLSDEEWNALKKEEAMENEKQSRDVDFFVPIEVTPEEARENKDTFFSRLEPFFAPSVLLDIKLAYVLAKHAHRAQFRKEVDPMGAKVRYFEHVRRVALVLFDEAKCTRPEMIISALLHDGIEDTRDLSAEMIEHVFGADVTSIVKMLSKTPKEGYLDRLQMCKDWRPLVIKACDRLDNLRSLSGPNISSEFREKQLAETQSSYLPLFRQMVSYTPEKCKTHANHLLDLIMEQLWRLGEGK